MRYAGDEAADWGDGCNGAPFLTPVAASGGLGSAASLGLARCLQAVRIHCLLLTPTVRDASAAAVRSVSSRA